MKLLGRIFLVIGLVFGIGLSSVPRLAHASLRVPDFYHLGIQQLQAGQYDAAIRSFSQSLQKGSAPFAVLSNRCFAYVQIEAYDSAIRDCSAAMAIAPQRSEAYLNRGLAYYQQGEPGRAIEDFTQAVQNDPESPEAYLDRGIAYSKVGKLGEALKDLKQAADFFVAHQQSEAYEYTLTLMEELQPSIAV